MGMVATEVVAMAAVAAGISIDANSLVLVDVVLRWVYGLVLGYQ